MYYALPYLVLMFLLAVLAASNAYVSPKLRDRMWMPCSLLLILFFAFRGYVGDDWTGYHVVYQFVQPRDFHLNIFATHSFRFEPGFAVLAYVCRQMAGGEGYLFFQGVVAFIQVVLLIRFLRRYTDNLPLSIIIFLAMGGLVMLINTMRNTIAILFFLNALPYLRERRFLPYLLYCLAAMSFHVSSAIFLPLYFVFHIRLPRWVFLVIFLLCNAVFLLKIPVLSIGFGAIAELIGGKIARMVNLYLEDQHMMALSFSISIGYLERLATGIIIMVFWDELHDLRKENVIFINAMILFFFFYFFFSEVREVGRRLSELFIFGYWILWPDLFRCFKLRLLRIGFASFLLIYCSLKVVGTVGYPNTRYENILTGFTQYRKRLHQHPDEAIEVTKAQNGE